MTAVDIDLDGELKAHRRELTGFCYRMLGSGAEAEDAVQETYVRAWKAIDRFEGRSSVRSWLYRIASNVCIDMHRARSAGPVRWTSARRPRVATAVLAPQAENTFVQPIADERVIDLDGDPADVAAARESIRLAFVAALQHLPGPPARGADPLRGAAVAGHRGRRAARHHRGVGEQRAPAGAGHARARSSPSSSTPRVDPGARGAARALRRRLRALRHDRAGRAAPRRRRDLDAAARPLAAGHPTTSSAGWSVPGHGCAGSKLLPVQVNGTGGFASYRPAGPGRWEPWAIQVIEVRDGRISGHHNFLYPELFAEFGLPPLPRGLTGLHPTAAVDVGVPSSRSYDTGEVPWNPTPPRIPSASPSSRPSAIARWRPLVAWLLVIPHVIVLCALAIVGVAVRVHRMVRDPLHRQAPGGPGRHPAADAPLPARGS